MVDLKTQYPHPGSLPRGEGGRKVLFLNLVVGLQEGEKVNREVRGGARRECSLTRRTLRDFQRSPRFKYGRIKNWPDSRRGMPQVFDSK